MNKKLVNIVSVLLICVMALSMAPLSSGNFASAIPGTIPANFLPSYFQDGLDSWYEVQLSHDVADYIQLVFLSKYSMMYDVRDGWCTVDNFYDVIEDQQSWDRALIYSKGHLGWNSCETGNLSHHGLAMNVENTTVWDYEIYQRTSPKNVHSFIWHCQTANLSRTMCTCGNYSGLPIAFTKNHNIPEWGSSGSQVYLGWKNKENLRAYNFTTHQWYIVENIKPNSTRPYLIGSPQYEWGINPNNNYAQVAATYYYYVGQGFSTNYALNKIADILYDESSMSDTDLHDWLVVYGNKNVGLPITPPYFATGVTKSSTGNGYVNNENDILGAPDGNYAYLRSGSFGNKAEVTVTFPTAPISGTLYVQCSTPSASGANLKIYVGYPNGGWTQVVNTNLYPSNTVILGSCGYVSNIDKVSIVAYHEYNGYPSYIDVDAVWVQ